MGWRLEQAEGGFGLLEALVRAAAPPAAGPWRVGKGLCPPCFLTASSREREARHPPLAGRQLSTLASGSLLP